MRKRKHWKRNTKENGVCLRCQYWEKFWVFQEKIKDGMRTSESYWTLIRILSKLFRREDFHISIMLLVWTVNVVHTLSCMDMSMGPDRRKGREEDGWITFAKTVKKLLDLYHWRFLGLLAWPFIYVVLQWNNVRSAVTCCWMTVYLRCILLGWTTCQYEVLLQVPEVASLAGLPVLRVASPAQWLL